MLSLFFLFTAIYINKKLYQNDQEDLHYYYKAQRGTILLMHFIGFIILVLYSDDALNYLLLYVQQVIFYLVVWLIINKFYKKTNHLIWNIVLYLLNISFIILTRLSYGVGLRQFRIAILGFALALVIPILIAKVQFIQRLTWGYMIGAITLLLLVNDTINGASNWITYGSFNFQPSELVKILYLLFLASFFRESITWGRLILSALFSISIVVILVIQKDLGGALIFSVLFITIIYLTTKKGIFYLGGLCAFSMSSVIAYKLFSHVRVRVQAWYNPWSDIDNTGYQITQSLFAIGAGGLIGTGLTKGLAYMVPVVTTDFIFSAICEEFGNIFSVVLIGLLVMLLMTTLSMATKVRDNFSLILIVGLGVALAFQQFLIIGGVIKLIPSTGVTLPFISYGGSSLVASCLMIGILQGIYMSKVYKKGD
jgi:cell division protein FtsW (lipid II flippase)